MTELVREGHQGHRAQAGLHIFFCFVFRQAFKDFFELRFEIPERIGDRNLKEFNSQIARQRSRVVDAPAR